MKTVMRTIVAALGMALAGSALAFDRDRGVYYDYAHVDSVDRIVDVMNQPATREECWQEPHEEFHPGANYRRDELAPVVVTSANGEQTVRSEVVESGGYVTHDVEEKCRSRTDYEQTPRVVAYDVVYDYRGQDYHDRLSHDPGTSVRVRVDHGYVELAE